MRLYQISDAIRILTDLESSDTGELAHDVELQLDSLGLMLEQKADSICRVIREMQAESEAYKEEAMRLASKAKARDGAIDRLTKYLKNNLDTLKIARLDTELFSVRIQKNSVPSVEVKCDPRALPIAFQKITVEPNKTALIAQYKIDAPMPEGVEIKHGTHLRIA